MPLHLNSITNDETGKRVFATLLHSGMDKCDQICLSKDNKYILLKGELNDSLTGECIAYIIFTIKHNSEDRVLEVLDLDLMLNSEKTHPVQFQHLRPGSSDSNEYYDAIALDNYQNLQLETVCRHTIDEELVGTERNVRFSVFPFQVSVFEDMDAFNGWAGLADGVKVGETDMVVQGFSPTFTMLGGIFGADEGNEECYTFLLGQVKQIKDVQIDFGDSSVPFTIVTAETGIGEVPIAVSRDVFELSELKEGCVLGINADVKADLALDDSFTRSGDQT